MKENRAKDQVNFEGSGQDFFVREYYDEFGELPDSMPPIDHEYYNVLDRKLIALYSGEGQEENVKRDFEIDFIQQMLTWTSEKENEEATLRGSNPDRIHLISNMLGRYRVYLKERLNKIKADKSTKPVSTAVQLLMISFLHDEGIFDINALHWEKTKQARLFSALFNKGYENVHKSWQKMTHPEHQSDFFTESNLRSLAEIFEAAGLEELAEKVKNRIDE